MERVKESCFSGQPGFMRFSEAHVSSSSKYSKFLSAVRVSNLKKIPVKFQKNTGDISKKPCVFISLDILNMFGTMKALPMNE